MKILGLLAFLSCFFMSTVQAESGWTNRFNGPGNGEDQARAIAVNSSGDVFVAGYTTGSGSGLDLTVIKYSNMGAVLWTNRYNGPANGADQANAVVVDEAGNAFVAGYSTGNSTGPDFVTIKYSSAGTALWTNTYNGPSNGADQALAIKLDTGGNVLVAGFSNGGGSVQDFTIIKYSNLGVAMWTNRYNGPGNGVDQITALALDANDAVIVTGPSTGSGSGLDYATIKYSSAGLPLWTNRYNGPGNSTDQPNAIALDSNGNVFVVGQSRGASSGDDFATLAYASDGTSFWTNRYTGAGNNSDQAVAVAVDALDNVIVTGSSFRIGPADDFTTIKYSNSGLPLWTNFYNGTGNFSDIPSELALDGAGRIAVTGQSFRGVANSWDFVTVAYSAEGVLLSTEFYNGPGNNTDRPLALAVDSGDNIYVAGYSYSSASVSSSDIVTIKYVSASAQQDATLERPGLVANGFSFDVRAEPGGNFAVQVNTNWTNWETIRQISIPSGGSTNIVEALLPAGQIYYRVQRQ